MEIIDGSDPSDLAVDWFRPAPQRTLEQILQRPT
jgi:hypothetical protein